MGLHKQAAGKVVTQTHRKSRGDVTCSMPVQTVNTLHTSALKMGALCICLID